MDRSSRCVEVRRDDLRTTRIVTQPLPPSSAGTALLRIERFGLSSNNVSYAVMGEQIGYWRFFPAADGWGRVPAWGFAEVVASHVDGLDPGVRVYGFLPMAEYLLVEENVRFMRAPWQHGPRPAAGRRRKWSSESS